MSELQGRFTSAESAKNFMLAGKAILTLRSVKTGTRYTYKITKAKGPNEDQTSFPFGNKKEKPGPLRYFVSLLSGPDNTSDYVYIGVVENGIFRLTKKSKMTSDSAPVKAFSWSIGRIMNGALPDVLEVWHEDRCGRCGRLLTVPESVSTGFGPECAGKIGS